MSRRLAFAVTPLVVAALVLTGCTAEPRIPAAEPQPTAAPLFATDEEALAAATAAYEEYLAVVDQILSGSGQDPEPLRNLVSEGVFEVESQGFNDFSENGWTAIGSSRLLNTTLQSHSPGDSASVSVSIYACVDVADVDVVDATGASVVSGDRPTTISYEAHFVGERAGRLILQDESLWSGGGVCVE